MKSEARNPKPEKSLRLETRMIGASFHAGSGFWISHFLRPSDLGLRISFLVFASVLLGPSTAHAAFSETNTLPQSVFTHPRSQSEGKDPFFPKSMRPYATAPVRTATPVEPVHLKLNGISFGEKPLALINGTPLAAGEERDVKNETSGKTHVKCIAIKEDSVIIEVGGEQQELRLRAKLH